MLSVNRDMLTTIGPYELVRRWQGRRGVSSK
jgi:hypothetical protein